MLCFAFAIFVHMIYNRLFGLFVLKFAFCKKKATKKLSNLNKIRCLDMRALASSLWYKMCT